MMLYEYRKCQQDSLSCRLTRSTGDENSIAALVGGCRPLELQLSSPSTRRGPVKILACLLDF